MGRRRGNKVGGLQRMLDEENDNSTPRSSKSLNRGRGQEITGVTLPAEGRLKGWEFGQGVRMACANVNGQFFALQVRTYVGPHVVFLCVSCRHDNVQVSPSGRYTLLAKTYQS